MALFDMPGVRNNKATDKALAIKSKSKSVAQVVSKGNSLIDRISLIKQAVEQKLGKYKDLYLIIQDEEQLKNYIDYAIKQGTIAIDTETTGLNTMLDTIAGVCIYCPGLLGAYIPLNHISYITGIKVSNQLSMNIVAEQLQRLTDEGTRIIMHNAKFDIRVIWYNLGVRLNCYFDTLLASQLLNENEPHGLKVLHQKYVLNGEGDAWSFDKLFDGIEFTKIPISTAYLYAARDPHITYELYEFQLPYMTFGTPENIEQGLEKVQEVFWNIEMKFLPVCVEMEDNGISLDLDYQATLHEKYNALKDKKLDEFRQELSIYSDMLNAYRIKHPTVKLDDPINISSPLQLSILLYDIIGIDIIDNRTPRGTGEKILSQIDLPICKLILEYRGLDKLMNTYIDKLPLCLNPNTNRIHCNFNQYGADTGRLSSDNPNMQNIPSHNTDIRKMFVASENHYILSADYSQQEPRCMAAMCQDPVMLQSYLDGKDLYAQIASVSFNVPYEDCLEFYLDGKTNKAGKERRTQAKSILLGILYGRGIDSIAEQLQTTAKKAQQIQDKIFKGFPAIKEFEESTLTMAETLGYVTTFWGRKRRLPEMRLPDYEFQYLPGHGDMDPLSFDIVEENLEVPYEIKQKYLRLLSQARFGRKRKIFEQANDEGIYVVDNTLKIQDAIRKCVNARIQGSAADLSKKAGIILANCVELRELGFKLLIPIHDEYLGECPKENVKRCSELFSQCMCEAAKDLGLPISCDVSISDRWYGEEISLC